MRIIVTGGAGFIGSHIADALLTEGHEVLVFDDLSTGSRKNVPASATFVQADLREANAVERVLNDFQPDVVCHQGAQTSVSVSTREPVRDAMINIIGSINLLEACVRHRVQRVVFASTGGAIYGEVAGQARATIDWAPAPLSPYACSKLAVERYLHAFQHEHGLVFTVLRYANVYGPRQDPHGEAGVVAIFTDRLLRNEPIQINARAETGDSGCIRDYVFVGDVVRANQLAIAGKLAVPVVNICTGAATTTLELAKLLESAVGTKAEIRFAPRRAGDLIRSVLGTNLPEQVGAKVSLQEGLTETVAWFRKRFASR
jgi:UDP-glucose 4-epimerase